MNFGRSQFVAGQTRRKPGAMNKKQKEEIIAAQLAVEEAKKAYEASVARYRAAVDPTAEELERHLYNRPDGEDVVDEAMLTDIFESRDEEEEEPESGQAGGA